MRVPKEEEEIYVLKNTPIFRVLLECGRSNMILKLANFLIISWQFSFLNKTCSSLHAN
jgi:hypothetical protein